MKKLNLILLSSLSIYVIFILFNDLEKLSKKIILQTIGKVKEHLLWPKTYSMDHQNILKLMNIYFSPSHFQLTGKHWPEAPHWNSSDLHSGTIRVQFSSSDPSWSKDWFEMLGFDYLRDWDMFRDNYGALSMLKMYHSCLNFD